MHRSTSRGAAMLGVAGLLTLAALGLTQCRMVADRVTGVELDQASQVNARSECVQACNEDFKACKRAEEDLYRANLATCGLLPSAGARRICQKEEINRHGVAQQACVDAKYECKHTCYNEGAGRGGE
jgi:hypothetical protein